MLDSSHSLLSYLHCRCVIFREQAFAIFYCCAVLCKRSVCCERERVAAESSANDCKAVLG